MNGLALCAGVGALELGIRLARPDYRTLCHVEWNPYCQQVLLERMQEGSIEQAPIWDDLGSFDGKPWRGKVDCISGGPPCQPFSSAARGRHVQPDLSGEVLRIVREVEPRVVFVENVYPARRSLAALRQAFSELGYDCPPLLECRASDVGAPHQRKRLFLLAHAHGDGKPDLSIDDEMEILSKDERSLWEDIPRFSGMADGTSSTMDRFQAIGNACVPLVAAYAWHVLHDGLSFCE